MSNETRYGRNPFTPGLDQAPPYLAGRDAALKDWAGWLAQLGRDPAAGEGAGHGKFVLMYGPRGTGKTALLDEFADMAREGQVDVARQNSEAFDEGPDRLADQLLADVQKAGFRETARKVSSSIGFKWFRGARESTLVHDDPPTDSGALKARLARHCQKKPLALLIDEAHAIEGKSGLLALKALTNAAQELTKTLPLILVLAGTPGLPQRLRDAGCTFGERADRRGIGLLDAEGSRLAIRRPLADNIWQLAENIHLAIADDALEHVVQDSQCYPYFLQHWGHALWEYAVKNEKGRLTLDDALTAGKRVEAARTFFYNSRGPELTEALYLLEAAVAVAEAFGEPDDTKATINRGTAEHAIDQSLVAKIPDDGKRRMAARDLLKHLENIGFCWLAPDASDLVAGIPSYMKFAMRLYAHSFPDSASTS